MQFDFWTRWGIGLTDTDYAAAWLALGIAAGAKPKPPATPAFLLEIARLAMANALSAAHAQEQSVRWRFPHPRDTLAADRRLRLTRIVPAAWADAYSPGN